MKLKLKLKLKLRPRSHQAEPTIPCHQQRDTDRCGGKHSR